MLVSISLLVLFVGLEKGPMVFGYCYEVHDARDRGEDTTMDAGLAQLYPTKISRIHNSFFTVGLLEKNDKIASIIIGI